MVSLEDRSMMKAEKSWEGQIGLQRCMAMR